MALLTIISIILFPAVSLAQVPANIQSPAQIAQWFAGEFHYETEIPDRWNSPEETMLAKKGDCEDFAILAYAQLSRLNIPSDIIIINFKGLPNQAHAVCVFKSNGSYGIISNQEYIQIEAGTIEAAISRQYPDWESIAFTTEKQETIKVVYNK